MSINVLARSRPKSKEPKIHHHTHSGKAGELNDIYETKPSTQPHSGDRVGDEISQLIDSGDKN